MKLKDSSNINHRNEYISSHNLDYLSFTKHNTFLKYFD